MSTTLRHQLPLLSAGQAQKEITHNEAILHIDRLLHMSVLSRQVNEPPALPAAGSAWIVGPQAAGAWAGKSGEVAFHDGYGWVFATATLGQMVWLQDEGIMTIWENGWTEGWPISTLSGLAPDSVAQPEGGAVVDVELRARFAELLSALRNLGVLA